ncbi:signal transduction histidine kinase [Mycolicibacterium aurum]|uniref:histidine kinase n=1 Tax=Mycolicibacterium aurum TaxID=1791 RepID=A0A3S4VJF9_MYCAU|nr:sensor histidine kinase [Mycolicibacterium aurum]VEG52759.1 signal transduction histidine kinase [Mycolicibacterium aurum]
MRNRSGLSLRVRITAATTAVVLLMLTLGAIAFVALLRYALIQTQGNAAEAQADRIAENAETMAGSSIQDVLPPFDGEDVVIQLQEDGRVIATADSDFAGLGPLPVSDTQQITDIRGYRYVVESSSIDGLTGAARYVVVGRSLESEDDATRLVSVLLTIAVPTVSLFVAALTWTVVGRSLRPVERIRLDVESIGDDPSRRVEPPGGRDEIARLTTTMNRMLDRLESAQRNQQRLVSNASHELRSPVAAIRQHAQVALHHPEATDIHSLASVVDIEAARLNDLVNDLLLLARLDEGRIRNRSEVDLDDIVLAEADRLRRLGVAVDTSRVGPARVLADEGLLARAVRNAADNARRHTRHRVDFTLTAVGGRVILTVDDDGEGIPEDDRLRLFHRFERRDDDRSREHGGAGLGLAIIAEAARDAGGQARLASSPSGGARLELSLPEHTD